MEIRENILLAPYTTFKIGGPARFFCVVKNINDVKQAVEFSKKNNAKILIIGGGSNMLVADVGFPGLVVLNELMGVEIVEDTESSVTWKIAAGESWDSIVKRSVDQSLWGIENLSHIPGKMGAFAVQNVGAYGQEASQVVKKVTVLDLTNGDIIDFNNKQCEFGYRQSVFNSSHKARYCILSTEIVLNRISAPNLSYRDLKARFAEKMPSLLEIRNAVIEIRNTKFPFPVEAINGNAGSFFKNPVVSQEEYESIEDNIAGKVSKDALELLRQKAYKQEDGTMKIPAAFLLDICGQKAMRLGGAKINPSQPLVIINETGAATAADVLGLANLVRQNIREKIGINLQLEPELIGFSHKEMDNV